MPYMNMPDGIQNRLEADGVQIVRKTFDFRMKTDLFIRLPDGRTLGYYNYMHEIPDSLYNGEEVSLGEQAIPEGAPIYVDPSGECTDANCGTIWDGDNPVASFDGESLVIPPAIIALIIFLAKVIAVFIVIYILMSKWLHPCGSAAYQTDIDQCIKVVTYPDCSTITIDSCNVDEQGNPKPKIIHETDPPGEDLGKLLLYGALAIGGIVVLMQVLKWSERKQYYRYHPEEMPRPKPSLPERAYGAVRKRI